MVAHQNIDNIKLMANLIRWQNSFYLDQAYATLKSQQQDILTACLDLGAIENITENQLAFLRVAIRESSPEILKMLIKKFKFSNQDKLSIINALLSTALEVNRVDMLECILAEGADPFTSNADNLTSTQLAVKKGMLAELQLLFKNCKLNEETRKTHLNLLLHTAIEENREDIVQYLLTQGADPLAVNAKMQSAAQLAIKVGSKDIVNLVTSNVDQYQLLKLLSSPPFDATDVVTIGKSLGWDNEFYQTQAWEAVIRKDLNTLGVCCLMGINLNRKKGKQKDKQKNKLYRGATLVHLAILHQFEAGAILLTQAGASLGIKDRRGITPAQLALSQPETSKYLQSILQAQSLDNSKPQIVTDNKQSSIPGGGFFQNLNATLTTMHSSNHSLPVYAVSIAKNVPQLNEISANSESLTFIESLRGLMIMGPNRETRLIALRLLNRLNFKSRLMHIDLLSSLEDNDLEVCYEAARGLGRLASDPSSNCKSTILRTLLDAAANKDPRYKRPIIMYALGQIDTTDRETIETLKQSLSSEDKEIQLEASTALFRLLPKHEKSLGIKFRDSFLLQLLKSPHSKIRGLVIEIFGAHTEWLKILIDHLIEGLDTHKETPDNLYKIISFLSFHILSSPEIVNSLFDKLQKNQGKLLDLLLHNGEDNSAIHGNILQLLRKFGNYDEIIKSLIQTTSNVNAQSLTRVNALYALGEEPFNRKTVMLMIPLLDDSNPDVSKAALIMVNKFKNCLGIAGTQSLEKAKFKWADFFATSVFDNNQTLPPIKKCINAVHNMCMLGINEQHLFQFFFRRVNQNFNNEQFSKIIMQFTDYNAIHESISCLFQTQEEKQQIASQANEALTQQDRSFHVGAIHILRTLNTSLRLNPLQSVFRVKTHPAHYFAAIALTEMGHSTPETTAVLFDVIDRQIPNLNIDASIALTSKNVFTWEIAFKLITHLSKGQLNDARAWDHLITAVCDLYKLEKEMADTPKEAVQELPPRMTR